MKTTQPFEDGQTFVEVVVPGAGREWFKRLRAMAKGEVKS